MMRLSGAAVGYGKHTVISNVSCVFNKGSISCIIGKNGCGKSTLLRAISGIQPYGGSILYDNAELREFKPKERAKRIAYLPQQRSVPDMDVKTLITHGRFPHLGFSKTITDRDSEIISQAVELTGIEHLLERSLSTLSGGERQRAYIAMMLAQDASMIILDEPTTHLDVEHQLEFMELIRKLCKSGKGIIIAAHDLPQAFTYADNIYLIAGGTLQLQGSPGELYKNEMLARTFGVSLNMCKEEGSLYRYCLTKKEEVICLQTIFLR